MVGHWESSIFHPPSDKSKRRRDIFPLPTIADESVSNASLSRAVRRRLEARSSVNKRVNLAVNSLNSMWFGGSSKYTKWEVSSLSGLPAFNVMPCRTYCSASNAWELHLKQAAKEPCVRSGRRVSI